MMKKYGLEILGIVAIVGIVLIVYVSTLTTISYTASTEELITSKSEGGNAITGNVILEGDQSNDYSKTNYDSSNDVDYIYVPSCGNGLIDYGEQCDDGDFDETDACVNCMEARCGDGYLWKGVEQCETTTSQGKSCQSFGYDYGELGCNDCGYDTHTCY